MAHGDILRVISEGYNSQKVNHPSFESMMSCLGKLTYDCNFLQPWANAEVRTFTFKSMDDEDAVLVPVQVPEAKAGSDEPTSSEF